MAKARAYEKELRKYDALATLERRHFAKELPIDTFGELQSKTRLRPVDSQICDYSSTLGVALDARVKLSSKMQTLMSNTQIGKTAKLQLIE
jgi:hypothetical protein